MKIKKTSKIEQALELASKEFYVLPIHPREKRPLTQWRNGGYWEQASTKANVIRHWWEQWPDANIALATEPSGILVLDVDVKNGKEGELALLHLDLDHVPIPQTLGVNTPTGGCHFYFKTDTPLKGRTDFLKEKVGTGLDIKSAGGYVLAPGSDLPNGTYEWVDPDVPIAPVPDELVRLLNQPHEQGPATEPGRFNPEQVEEMLAHLDPSEFRDQGEWFNLMCSCHHATAGQAREEFVAWSVSDPPFRWDANIIRSRWDSLGKDKSKRNIITELTLIQHVLKAGGTVPVDRPEDDFDTIVETPIASKRFLTLAQIKNLPPASWLIKGFIPESSFGILYGEPGTLKSFLALHTVLCLANGNDFFGRTVRQGAVFYLAGESAAGFRPRTTAWEHHFGYSHAHPPFHLQIGGAALNRDGEVGKLAHDILDISKTPKLIVIDTVQVYLAGNENSPEDMGSLVRGCLELRDRTGAAVLVIHHLGKDASRGARGHTSLIGAADFIYKTNKKEQVVEVVCQKMKEADDRFRMILEPVSVLVDPDGEFPDSLVLRESNQPLDTETTEILRLATEFDGKGQKELVQAVKEELQISSAYQKIKKAIPEGKENAVPFEGGSLWIEPHPTNPRGARTVRYEEAFAEVDEEVDESDFMA